MNDRNNRPIDEINYTGRHVIYLHEVGTLMEHYPFTVRSCVTKLGIDYLVVAYSYPGSNNDDEFAPCIMRPIENFHFID